MAENESLRRQIELLQGIINKHKTVHGNVPAPLSSAARTWRNPVQSTNSAPQVLHAGPSQRDFPHQHHQLQKPLQPKPQQLKPPHLQEQHRQQLQQLQQKLDQQKLLQVKLQQQKLKQQQSQLQLPKQKPPPKQQQPQQPEPQEQSPQQQRLARDWRKKYSLVNKPQAPAQPSELANVPMASTNTLTSRGPQLTLPKQPDSLPAAKGRGQSVWVSSAYSKTAGAVNAARRVPSAVNSGMPSLGTVLVKTQTMCCEEPCKFLKKSALGSQQQSLVEVCNQRKQDRLKEQGEISTPCTTLTKGTKIRNSTTKWTSELCRTRSENALVLSGKPQKSPTLRSHVQRGPTTVKILESPVRSPTNSDDVNIGGHFTKVRPNPSTVACTSPSQVSLNVFANPLKRRLVTTHTIFSPQKCVTPTLGKVLKCRKTKYTWVANPLRVSRTSRKSVSPKMVEGIRKSPVGTSKTVPAKVSPKGDVSVKSKKSPVLLKGGASSSTYKWKAPTSVASSAPSKSKFKWHAEAQSQHRGSQPLTPKPVVPQTLAKPASNFGVSKSPFSDSSHPGYKVKSRTKIICRKTSSPTDKKSSPIAQDTVKSHYFLRRRTPPKIQTVKKISPKGLVQISKHKLRRLPAPKTPAVAREGISPTGLRSTPATRVITTRYKIVKRNVACSSSPAASISPTLLWKARKLSAARWLLLNRMRQISPAGKPTPLQQQRWKSRGLRCIGGVMYRVSANKLSKHTSPPMKTSDVSSKYFSRSGRLISSPNSPTYISPNGTSRLSTPSRYIASRAVQRSLAIIRQAKQKKKKTEYCMYYNRFGKCNRGENCPYIHDPEKVAVCTRFLRGTCKKTDGTCTFSHMVSKDKMPVCSFYLRGICSNSSCPYSHVYVSKKAEVCQEFLKGYCPLGEKCKKKHTLVCPDFAKKGSCPKGAKCKLQHRQHKRNKRPLSSTEQQDQDKRAAKQGRHEIGASRNVSRFSEERSVKASTSTSPSEAEQPGTSGLQKLPSFISLKSLSPTSPTEVRPPPRQKSGDDTGKPLQIKPRL